MDKQARWRNGTRLKQILTEYVKLPKQHRTTRVLLFATDAAKLSREFVAEKMNPSLVSVGADPIEFVEVPAVDAGEE